MKKRKAYLFMNKVRLRMLSLVLSIMLLTGCAENPKQEVVVSKNDGSFDIGIVQSATVPTNDINTATVPSEDSTINEAEPPKELFQYHSQFMSSDNTVEFTIDLNADISDLPMPVVEVTPHYVTSEDAKRVATVLFGNVDYYESDPIMAPTYSKDQIRSLLATWAKYIQKDELCALYGSDYEYKITNIQSLIERYTILLESAPEINPDVLSQWEMKKESYYIYAEEDINNMDISKDNDQISVSLVYQNLPYQFSVTTRNQSDFKINNIRAILAPNSPTDIDYDILRAELCRTDEPTELEVENAELQVKNWLSQMDMGDWEVRTCSVQTRFIGDTPEYTIHINAVPKFYGVAALYRDQLYNLKSDKAYASNYYFTDVNFIFAPGGELLYFEMYSPVDVTNLVTENAVTLSIDSLIERAKNHLMLSDIYAYGLGDSLDEYEEEMACTVEIVDLEYGLTRVKAQDTDEHYYYVPAIILRGNVKYIGRMTNSLYYTTEESPDIILILNATDGTVIDHSGI